jgi:hypothetical protein
MTRLAPNPVEHAMVLIEVCGGLEPARAAADLNCTFATTTKDFMYWIRVSCALTPAEDRWLQS